MDKLRMKDAVQQLQRNAEGTLRALYMSSCGMVDDIHHPDENDLGVLNVQLDASVELIRKNVYELLAIIEKEAD